MEGPPSAAYASSCQQSWPECHLAVSRVLVASPLTPGGRSRSQGRKRDLILGHTAGCHQAQSLEKETGTRWLPVSPETKDTVPGTNRNRSRQDLGWEGLVRAGAEETQLSPPAAGTMLVWPPAVKGHVSSKKTFGMACELFKDARDP